MNRRARRPCTAGFTLIELLIVMVVIALVTLVAGPALTEVLGKSTLKGGANELYADLHYARSESVQRNAAVTVSFSSTGYTVTTGATTLKTLTFTGLTVNAGSGGTVVFSPTRATATVSGLPVELAHPQTSALLRVNVNALGRAEICSPSAAMPGYSAC